MNEQERFIIDSRLKPTLDMFRTAIDTVVAGLCQVQYLKGHPENRIRTMTMLRVSRAVDEMMHNTQKENIWHSVKREYPVPKDRREHVMSKILAGHYRHLVCTVYEGEMARIYRDPDNAEYLFSKVDGKVVSREDQELEFLALKRTWLPKAPEIIKYPAFTDQERAVLLTFAIQRSKLVVPALDELREFRMQSIVDAVVAYRESETEGTKLEPVIEVVGYRVSKGGAPIPDTEIILLRTTRQGELV